jgi:hypothetical protein
MATEFSNLNFVAIQIFFFKKSLKCLRIWDLLVKNWMALLFWLTKKIHLLENFIKIFPIFYQLFVFVNGKKRLLLPKIYIWLGPLTSDLWQSKLQKNMFALSSLSLNPLVWNLRFSKPTMYQVADDYFFTGHKPGKAGIEMCLGPPKWEIFG